MHLCEIQGCKNLQNAYNVYSYVKYSEQATRRDI